MKDRLQDIIKYKTGGRQKAFADLLGWSPQYLTKLLRGDNIGLQPVLTLLAKLPEINARWFLFGEGDMLDNDKLLELRREAFARVRRFLDLERYMSVMAPDELGRFEAALAGGAPLDFGDEDVSRWDALLSERESKINAAIQKSVS